MALEVLSEAIDKGFGDLQRMQSDAQLDSLRERAAYQEMVRNLSKS
jgi:hypothetical protein